MYGSNHLKVAECLLCILRLYLLNKSQITSKEKYSTLKYSTTLFRNIFFVIFTIMCIELLYYFNSYNKGIVADLFFYYVSRNIWDCFKQALLSHFSIFMSYSTSIPSEHHKSNIATPNISTPIQLCCCGELIYWVFIWCDSSWYASLYLRSVDLTDLADIGIGWLPLSYPGAKWHHCIGSWSHEWTSFSGRKSWRIYGEAH